jgi:hypothetical protein
MVTLWHNEPHHPGGNVFSVDVNWNFGAQTGNAFVVGSNRQRDHGVDLVAVAVAIQQI